ncbi:type II secretion system F family protein [bacterium]|nr:type II secretion system F family protein [bacterium]
MLEKLPSNLAPRFLVFHESTWTLSGRLSSDTLSIKQRSLLRLLAVSHREQLDLHPLVENLAAEHRGHYRRLLKKLTRRLKEGIPILAALEQTPDVINETDLLSLQLAVQTGTIGETYRQRLDEGKIVLDENTTIRKHLYVYSFILALLTMLTTLFLMVFIIPMLETMIKEFDVGMNHQITLISTVSGWLINLFPMMILCAFIGAFILWSRPTRRFLRHKLIRRLTPNTQVIRTCEFLEFIASTLEAGRPASSVLPTLTEKHFDARFRKRLQKVDALLNEKENLWHALFLQGILNESQYKALDRSTSLESRVWCLRELSEQRRQGIQRSQNLIMRLGHPMVTLLFAGIVLIISGAMIRFLADLINALAQVI